MLKIAQISRGCWRYGGAARVVWELSSNLVRQGHEVTIFSNLYEPVAGARFVKVPMLTSQSLKGGGNAAWAKILELYTFAFLARTKLRRADFDIVHVHGDSFVDADLRTCHSCHAAWLEQSRAEAKGAVGWLKKNANPYHKIVLEIEKHDLNDPRRWAVALSSQIKREVLEYYRLPSERIELIPNGVDLEAFHPRNRDSLGPEVRRRYGIGPQDVVLIFVGWQFKRKGLDIAIEALARLDVPAKLLVVGSDDAAPYRELARRLGLVERVIFTGAVKDVPAHLAAADIFVFPTDYEAFSLAIAEAAAAGLAIATTRIAGAADLFRDGVDAALLENPRDPAELAARLAPLAADAALRRRFGEAARAAAETISWDAVSKRYVELYSKIVQNRKS